jgi:hypothetical protein
MSDRQNVNPVGVDAINDVVPESGNALTSNASAAQLANLRKREQNFALVRKDLEKQFSVTQSLLFEVDGSFG